jgi:hypothetical protein
MFDNEEFEINIDAGTHYPSKVVHKHESTSKQLKAVDRLRRTLHSEILDYKILELQIQDHIIKVPVIRYTYANDIMSLRFRVELSIRGNKIPIDFTIPNTWDKSQIQKQIVDEIASRIAQITILEWRDSCTT